LLSCAIPFDNLCIGAGSDGHVTYKLNTHAQIGGGKMEGQIMRYGKMLMRERKMNEGGKTPHLIVEGGSCNSSGVPKPPPCASYRSLLRETHSSKTSKLVGSGQDEVSKGTFIVSHDQSLSDRGFQKYLQKMPSNIYYF